MLLSEAVDFSWKYFSWNQTQTTHSRNQNILQHEFSFALTHVHADNIQLSKMCQLIGILSVNSQHAQASWELNGIMIIVVVIVVIHSFITAF